MDITHRHAHTITIHTHSLLASGGGWRRFKCQTGKYPGEIGRAPECANDGVCLVNTGVKMLQKSPSNGLVNAVWEHLYRHDAAASAKVIVIIHTHITSYWLDENRYSHCHSQHTYWLIDSTGFDHS